MLAESALDAGTGWIQGEGGLSWLNRAAMIRVKGVVLWRRVMMEKMRKEARCVQARGKNPGFLSLARQCLWRHQTQGG